MFKYIGFVIRLLPTIIWNYLTWIIRYSRHPEKYELEKRYKRVRKLIVKVLKGLHVDLHIENEELIKDGEIKLFTPNHQSFIDPLLLIALSEKPISFVAKIETKKMIVVGRIMKIIDGQFIDRDDLKQQIKVLRTVEKSLEERKISWVIFPEGTRNKNINEIILNELHPGTYKIALSAGVKIIPVAIEGTYRILSTKISRKRYPVNIAFIDYDVDNKKFANSIELRDDVTKVMKDKLVDLIELNKSYK